MARCLPPLPSLLKRKIYKTGQTRGADDDVIYQNRVGRNSTVLIPFASWSNDFTFPEEAFEKGYIVLVPPAIEPRELTPIGLRLGENCLYFYETRNDWELYNPQERGYHPANSRTSPLGGNMWHEFRGRRLGRITNALWRASPNLISKGLASAFMSMPVRTI